MCSVYNVPPYHHWWNYQVTSTAIMNESALEAKLESDTIEFIAVKEENIESEEDIQGLNEETTVYIKIEDEVNVNRESLATEELGDGAVESESDVLVSEDEDPLLLSEPFTVEDCGSMCWAEDNQAVNKERKKVNSKEGSVCQVCGKIFSDKTKLLRHMRVHTREKIYNCEVCIKVFSSENSLLKHMTIHAKDKPYICEICGSAFSRKYTLVQHMRVHTDKNPYNCKECSKTFSQKQHLVQHMRVHTREKPYSCEICSKAFSQKHHQVDHMRVHTKEKAFTCDVCSKLFAWKCDLVVHMGLHSKEKPFKCEVCSKSFGIKSYLVNHMRVHTKEKPYRCETCSKAFSRKHHLVKHTKLHTKEKQPNCDNTLAFNWQAVGQSGFLFCCPVLITLVFSRFCLYYPTLYLLLAVTFTTQGHRNYERKLQLERMPYHKRHTEKAFLLYVFSCVLLGYLFENISFHTLYNYMASHLRLCDASSVVATVLSACLWLSPLANIKKNGSSLAKVFPASNRIRAKSQTDGLSLLAPVRKRPSVIPIHGHYQELTLESNDIGQGAKPRLKSTNSAGSVPNRYFQGKYNLNRFPKSMSTNGSAWAGTNVYDVKKHEASASVRQILCPDGLSKSLLVDYLRIVLGKKNLGYIMRIRPLDKYLKVQQHAQTIHLVPCIPTSDGAASGSPLPGSQCCFRIVQLLVEWPCSENFYLRTAPGIVGFKTSAVIMDEIPLETKVHDSAIEFIAVKEEKIEGVSEESTQDVKEEIIQDIDEENVIYIKTEEEGNPNDKNQVPKVKSHSKEAVGNESYVSVCEDEDPLLLSKPFVVKGSGNMCSSDDDKSIHEEVNKVVSHERVHAKGKCFVCEVCRKCFFHKSKLIIHMRVHTMEKPYICEVCSKAFAMKCNLVKHIRIHTKEKPYSCEVCRKVFSEKGTLMTHMRVHTKEKPFVCDECSKAFSQKTDLVNHMRTHSKEKPYSCEICGKAFSVKNNQVQHMKVHTKEKPFNCEACSKDFARKSDLVRHIRVHTKEKPFCCEICSRAFSAKSDLARHLRLHT
ncbi:uncharacterized protein LOC122260372 [Penaeus japonicus]|uniref:uncharacterized protein LOC122260372 n=1 Tax=Penaeus japonicus TaxID=27405 RepID=UPI001C713ACA|nr:uncharacterized protein LOC122260372 [Penaeus japonicus]